MLFRVTILQRRELIDTLLLWILSLYESEANTEDLESLDTVEKEACEREQNLTKTLLKIYGSLIAGQSLPNLYKEYAVKYYSGTVYLESWSEFLLQTFTYTEHSLRIMKGLVKRIWAGEVVTDPFKAVKVLSLVFRPHGKVYNDLVGAAVKILNQNLKDKDFLYAFYFQLKDNEKLLFK